MRKASFKRQNQIDLGLVGGIEWIVARELAPIQDELTRLRAYVEALRETRIW